MGICLLTKWLASWKFFRVHDLSKDVISEHNISPIFVIPKCFSDVDEVARNFVWPVGSSTLKVCRSLVEVVSVLCHL